MSREHIGNKLTASERLTATMLRWSPLLVFLVLAIPTPAYFLFRYFTATENVGEHMIFAMTSLVVGSIFGLIAAFLVFLYRRFWERRLRERLAADGVTAGELSLFMSELTAPERRSLAQMEARNPLLADAYRETLAARITASRVLLNARRETAKVEERLKRASGLQSASRAELEQNLMEDRERLSRVERETSAHKQEIETRLQIIEAMSGRASSDDETRIALQRLGSVRNNIPLGLTAAQSEQEARDEVEKELRDLKSGRATQERETEKAIREIPPRTVGR